MIDEVGIPYVIEQILLISVGWATFGRDASAQSFFEVKVGAQGGDRDTCRSARHHKQTSAAKSVCESYETCLGSKPHITQLMVSSPTIAAVTKLASTWARVTRVASNPGSSPVSA